MIWTLTPAELDLLATALSSDGPASLEAELAHLVDAARAIGISGPVVDLVADPTRADVIRQRAFAHLHAVLSSPVPRPVVEQPRDPQHHCAA